MSTINLKFASPHDSSVLTADVSPNATALQTIEEMVNGDFLQPMTRDRAYGLVHSRSGKLLLPNQELGEADIYDGDTLHVIQASRGARKEF